MARWQCWLRAALLTVMFLAQSAVSHGGYAEAVTKVQGRTSTATTSDVRMAVLCPLTSAPAVVQAAQPIGLDGFDIPQPARCARRGIAHATLRSRDTGGFRAGHLPVASTRLPVRLATTRLPLAADSLDVTPPSAPTRELLQVFRS